MTLFTVGPKGDYRTITRAMDFATNGDTIQLLRGYSYETATVRYNGMTILGGSTSVGIVLQLLEGVTTVTLSGTSDIRVRDAIDDNSIVGNDGDNIITVRLGDDAVDGGLGNDRLIVDYRSSISAITGDSTSNFAEAGGSMRSVTVVAGTIEHFTVLTGDGADTITTGAGNDIIRTGEGASTVTAGEGYNIIVGGSGADTITALNGGNFVGAGNGANTVTTGAGKDRIFTGIGSDTVISGEGDDFIKVRGGADTVDAGAGIDTLRIDYSSLTTDVIGGVTSGNRAAGYTGSVADMLENSVNFSGADRFAFLGGSGNDIFSSGARDDTLNGNAGDDQLNGGRGSDRIFGGSGDDTIIGGNGGDTVRGGSGDDVFVFATVGQANSGVGRDTIRDFEKGDDKINLSGMDANENRGGNQRFTFIGSQEFTDQAGQLRFANGVLTGDTDGDGRADFMIAVNTAVALGQNDFLL